MVISCDSITGGVSGLSYNPGSTVSTGVRIDLTGSSGPATINSFSFGGVDLPAANDTVIAGNGNVTAIDGNKLTVQFDHAGEKRVVDSFVQPA